MYVESIHPPSHRGGMGESQVPAIQVVFLDLEGRGSFSACTRALKVSESKVGGVGPIIWVIV